VSARTVDQPAATPAAPAPGSGGGGAWSPLASRPFLWLWLATVASNMGTWMHDVGAGWLMTTLSPSPVMVALVQAATTLPVFLLALPAGAIADLTDRRRLLIAASAAMAVVAAGAMTAPLLLAGTFLLGAGAAFVAPAWQAIVPALVPRGDLPAAVALNGLGVNVSRAIGPALAGVLIVALGLWAPFLANTVSFLGILAVLALWQGEARPETRLPAEGVAVALVGGVRYARHSADLKRTIARAVAFFVFASAYGAMLPLVARTVLGGGSTLYGLLMGCVGAGAVAGALGMPWLRRRHGPDALVFGGTLATAAAMAAFGLAAAIAAVAAGAGWITVFASLQVSAQAALPHWIRARGLSLYLMGFFGAMAGGATLWGFVAQAAGVAAALLIAAAGLVVAAGLTRRIALVSGDGSEHVSSQHWPAPPVLPPEEGERGPVMIAVAYRVPAANRAAFLAAAGRLGEARRRDGAYEWHLFEDAHSPGLIEERILVARWVDHLRQHDRVREADRALQAELAALCDPAAGPPAVRHLVAAAG